MARHRTLSRFFLGLILILAAGWAYTYLMGRTAPGTPPPMAAADTHASRIVVHKSQRRMELWRDDILLRSYRIALGGAGDEGHKQSEGDQRTPEGNYVIDWRNPRSRAFLSLHISYPNSQDSQAAAQAGRSPGGDIMIHGLPNGWGALGAIHHLRDWTDGCIGVNNDEMQEIWSLVPNGTPIDIRA